MNLSAAVRSNGGSRYSETVMTMIGLCAVVIALVVSTTLLHYEALRLLNVVLPCLNLPSRMRLIVVIFGAFISHAMQIALYAAATYGLIRWFNLGTLGSRAGTSMEMSLYFSAETYTSLGYGDVIPQGALRLLAGAEALNGLLLIGWSASYTYVAMERFWKLDRFPARFAGNGRRLLLPARQSLSDAGK